MKKLLLLGGSRYLLPVIEAAHQIGVYVITCDYLPNNYAHQFSDEYHNVSIVDKEAILKLAQELRIDGILSFATDPGVVVAAYVSEKMGLPGSNPYQSVCILQNKGRFRDFLKKNGFNVPRAKAYKDIESALAEISECCLPIIVKPTDSAGSKGVTKVEDLDDLEEAIQRALRNSHSEEFIIEEFVEKIGYSSDSDCFSVDGKLVFVSFSDQSFDENAKNPYTPSAFMWPSTMPESFQKELRMELQRLIALLDMGTSIYNVETRVGKDGKAYIMEVSPRGGGNRLAEIIEYATGTDLIMSAVKASLGESISEIHGDPDYKYFWGELILHADQEGVFEKLEIDQRLTPYIVEKDIWVSEGAEVKAFTGANQTIGTIVFRFDDEEQKELFMRDIYKFVKVVVS